MNKKTLIVIALIFFASLAITSTSFAEDEGRSYSVSQYILNIFIQENGSLHVVEERTYVFSGTWNGVTRNIPLKSNERIENLDVSTLGAYAKYEYDENGKITVYLYSDPEFRKPSVTNKEVTITYRYDFINVLKLYNDGATLHYTLWTDEETVDLSGLWAYVHLKDNNGVKYWLNPSELLFESTWNGTFSKGRNITYPEGWSGTYLEILTTSSMEDSSASLFELRMIIPKDYFTNPVYALKYNKDGITAFENLQKEYEDGVNFFSSFYEILSLIILIICVFPIVIYFKYGREPKILYKGIYEREIPTHDSPAIANALYEGNVGSVDKNAFKASILSLVNKKYLRMENFENSNNSSDENPKNPTIKFKSINTSDLLDLSSSERSAFRTLRTFANRSDELDLEVFNNDMQDYTSAKKFKDYYDSWEKGVENEAKNNIEKFFDSKGYDYAMALGFGGLILSGIIIFASWLNWLPFTYVSSFNLLYLPIILLIIVSIVSIALPNHIFGRWTVEGRENKKKWSNFRKYLKDFSLIKEHPPSSVEIWNQYLVYGTALGIAKTVQKNMEKLIPKEILDRMDDDSYYFYSYGGASLFSSFDDGISKGSASDPDSSSDYGGGSGGFGGGSGGGGDGAF